MFNYDKAFDYNPSDLQKGALLLSEPFMEDPNFRRSVIVICEHDDQDGTIGYVINQKVQINLHDILEDFPEVDAQVFYGGPVEQDSLHFLHTKGAEIEGSIEIKDGIYRGGNFEQIKMLLTSQPDQVEHFKFFLGYSGWSSGQLDEELKYRSWMIVPGSYGLIWNAYDSQDWNSILANKGGIFKQIANFPTNPQLN